MLFRSRESAANALVDNVKLMITSEKAVRNVTLILWGACIKLFSDDEPTIRNKVSDVLQEITSGEKHCPNVAKRNLMDTFFHQLSLSDPVGLILTCLGTVLDLMFDEEGTGTQDISLEVDKAYDKNEMNCYQEVVGHTLFMVRYVRKLVNKLSLKMLKFVHDKEVPYEIVKEVVPEMPGAVRVYSIAQLLDYLKVRVTSEISGTERADRKSTRLNSSHSQQSRMPSSA